MSWLSIPLPNPFKFQPPDDDDEEDLPGEEEEVVVAGGGGGGGEEEEEEEESSSPGGGVKEDLSELTKTIGRQLWGVASFLAPPPVTSSPHFSVDSTSTHDSSSQTLLGIRNDFAEIGGSFKSGLSLFSTNKAVNEISKLASNFLLFPKDGDDEESKDVDEFSVEGHGGDIFGVTEEVLEFVREMSMRPECWTDFPLSLDNDFEMSDAQREHASAVENLAPSLAGLNVRLCPSHMNEGQFWMIYFILLHPRLNERDSKLLSTPQIIEARDSLLQKLRKKVNEQVESSKNGDSSIEVSDRGTKIQEESNSVQEKEVLVETVNSPHHIKAGEQENTEEWLEEENETDTSVAAHKQLGNEEDVSFSDLEDDDDDDNTSSRQSFLNSEKDIRVSSSNGSSNEWVRLNENSDSREKKVVQTTSREKDSEGEESNDWLTIDDSD